MHGPVEQKEKPKPDHPLKAEPLLQFFGWEHLPPELQDVSKRFGELAIIIEAVLPRNPERTVCLRKLLEAKDSAVRAKIYIQP